MIIFIIICRMKRRMKRRIICRMKLLWVFEIQTHHLNSVRRPDHTIVNKKNENQPNCEFFRPGRSQSKIEK